MNDTATVRIFLVKGSPTSVRTAEISNWTGKAVAGPRSQLEDMLKREEATKPGVYFLAGVNPESKMRSSRTKPTCFSVKSKGSRQPADRRTTVSLSSRALPQF